MTNKIWPGFMKENFSHMVSKITSLIDIISSILAADYIQKRRGQALLFSFEYYCQIWYQSKSDYMDRALGWSPLSCFAIHCETKNLLFINLYLLDYPIRYWLRLSNDLGPVGPWLSLVTALVFHIFSAFLTLLVSSHL